MLEMDSDEGREAERRARARATMTSAFRGLQLPQLIRVVDHLRRLAEDQPFSRRLPPDPASAVATEIHPNPAGQSSSAWREERGRAEATDRSIRLLYDAALDVLAESLRAYTP